METSSSGVCLFARVLYVPIEQPCISAIHVAA